MKTCTIVLCKDEMDNLPYVRRYWERIGCDVVVMDNGSTDGSLEYLSKLPYVRILHFDSEGHNDVIQKSVKEQAYRMFKNQYDIIVISDLDEVFYFSDFKALSEAFVASDYNVLMTPIITLCESFKPPYSEDKLLHQQCHMFYKQRMNHMEGFDDYSKLSIFNTRLTDRIEMSVGQHYVQTYPAMNIMLTNDGFNLHICNGFGEDYFVDKRKMQFKRLSDTNKKYGMGVEYGKDEQQTREEYRNNQKKSFDINDSSGTTMQNGESDV